VSNSIHNPALIPPGVGGGVGGIGSRTRTQPVSAPQSPGAPAFADVLRTVAAPAPASVSFSKHAVQRLERRGLAVDGSTMGRLTDGVDRAAGKGARDAVVLVDDTAFVVSVRNRTVITAVAKDQMKDHVFTNIDSAVIA
jgi:flagellar operon protein